MAKKRHCQYCGCKTSNVNNICNGCNEKLKLIRKIRAIIFMIKKDSEGDNTYDAG